MDIEQVRRGANTFIIFVFEGKIGDQNIVMGRQNEKLLWIAQCGQSLKLEPLECCMETLVRQNNPSPHNARNSSGRHAKMR